MKYPFGELTLLVFTDIEFTYSRSVKSVPHAEVLPQSLSLDHQQTLQGVSFSVQKGEWVVLLGANGSGKSTLARLANGLLLPNIGEVVVDGISSWKHDKLPQLRKLVGLVAQDPDNQIVSTTVFDEVAFGPQNLGWEPQRIYTSVSEALNKVGLPEDEFAKRDPNSLSGGEKQRVVIAAILAMEPSYIVLDEPTAMLDPAARAQVLEAVALTAEDNHGVLHITHNLEEAASADRVLVLDQGKLVYDGAPEGILTDEEALTRYGLFAKPEVEGQLARPSEDNQTEDNQTEDNQLILELSEVSFSYPSTPKRSLALEECNMTVATGECHVLVGKSGAGKSTLLSLAAGLLKPGSGKVRLNNKAPVPGQVGLVFQHPETQLFAQTLFDDILFGPRNLGTVSKEEGEELVDSVLTAVGLSPQDFKNRSPFSLSGGEARRSAIATTLALKTDIVLLDEPTAGLDARGKVFIYELVQKLLAEGKGIVIATHDPEYFASLETERMEL